MDAFYIAVGCARIDPIYFWFSMDFKELESLGLAYRETWEQTRLIAGAISGEKIRFPWDDEVEAKQTEAAKKRIAAAKPKLKAAAKSIRIEPVTRNP